MNLDALIDARTLAAVAARLVFDATAGASLTPLQAEIHRRAVNLCGLAVGAIDELLASADDAETGEAPS